jgi:hypothetical protein
MTARTPRPKADPTPLEKMRELTRRLVAVPKSELKQKGRTKRKKRA